MTAVFLGQYFSGAPTVAPPPPPDPLLQFEMRKRNSAVVYQDGDTVLVPVTSAYLDLDLEAQKDIASVTATDGPLASQVIPLTAQSTRVRMYANLIVQRYEISVAYTDGESLTKTVYIGTNEVVGKGQQITGITGGPITTSGPNFERRESPQILEANNNKVTLTMGGAPDRPSTLQSVTITIYERPSGKHVSSASYANDNLKGLASVTAENRPAGLYAARTVYTFSDSNDNWVEEFYFEIRNPTPQPWETSLNIFNPTLNADETLRGFVWTDSFHTVIKQELLVDGVSYPRSNVAGGRTLLIPLADIGMEAVGSYTLQWKVTLSDTDPTTSLSDPVTVTVEAVPNANLFADAIATPNDNPAWNAALTSPSATAQQKAIAADMVALNGEFAAGVDFGIPTFEVINDRDNYLAELTAGTTTKTFSAWIRQQGDFSNPQEIQETKDYIASVPTSSIAAMLAFFNSRKHPWGSMIRLILGGIPGYSSGDWLFIRSNAQSYGGEVSDAVIRSDYQRFQAFMATSSIIYSFEDWIQAGN